MSYPRIVVDATGERVPLLGERVRLARRALRGTVVGRRQPQAGRWIVSVLWDDSVNGATEHDPNELRD